MFDALALPLSTGMEEIEEGRDRDPRGHPADQGRAPRGLHRPGPVQRLLRPQSGRPPGAQLRLPPRVRGGRPRRGHRARLEDPAPVQDRRTGPRGVPRPHLRPTPRRLRPADRAAGPVRGGVGLGRRDQGGPHGLDGRAAARAPHHRRRPQRNRGRPRRGDGRGPHPAGHHQRLPAGRHEDGGRAVRLRRDAAALRAGLGRDHEGGGGLPRAVHGEGRPGGQGHHGPGHGQGRRARHRQEPGRHHPDQQRLHGEEPGHQGGHRRDGGRRSRSPRPTPSG